MHRQRFSVVRRFVLSNRPILSDAFIAMTTTFYDVLWIFHSEHHKSLLVKKDILRKRWSFTAPPPTLFSGTPLRLVRGHIQQNVLERSEVQPLELSERAELESPPPLRGALGTILI